MDMFFSKLLANFYTINPWQKTIKNNKVIFFTRCQIKSICPIIGNVYSKIFLFKPFFEGVGYFMFIFYDKYSHTITLYQEFAENKLIGQSTLTFHRFYSTV